MDDNQFDLDDETFRSLASFYPQHYMTVRVTENSFEQVINRYNKTRLQKLAKRLGIKGYSKWKKPELIAALKAVLFDEKIVCEYFYLLSDLGYQTVTEHLKDNNQMSVYEFNSIYYLSELGFFYFADYYLLISQEVLDYLNNIFNKESYQKNRKQVAFMSGVLHYCDYIYPVIDIDMMYMMYQSHVNVSKEEFLEIYENMGSPIMRLTDHQFISNAYDEQAADEYVKDTASYVISMPSEDELVEYMNYGFPYSKPEWEKLFHVLYIDFMMDPLACIDVMCELFILFVLDADIDYIFRKVIMNFVTEDDIDMMDKLFNAMIACHGNVRHAAIKGGIPRDMTLRRLKNGEGIKLPDDENIRKVFKENEDLLKEKGYEIDDQGNIILSETKDKNGFYS